MTINEILTEAFEKIKQEHNTVITEVNFEVICTNSMLKEYVVIEIDVRGKVV